MPQAHRPVAERLPQVPLPRLAMGESMVAGPGVKGVERLPVLHRHQGPPGAIHPAGEKASLRVVLQVAQDAAEHPQAPEEAGQPLQPVEPHAEQEDRKRLVPPGHPAAGPHRLRAAA
jgi:hypothetical protein